ncbi:hypothetical protein F5X68DRAFT_172060 [Plectosphaerella plurivora]|uniref:C3H1-type domain-containing protein n=1 Tax=Plectosphaerella plurivora TaxID=936078 RepID=A0A9P8V880_9PEZI|nr:hypothetical protein F5X68DRAFT_172060 [Plectosphaerella plurivora]
MTTYNYAPPPPPPPAAQATYGHQGGHYPQAGGAPRGGGAASRGRGGHAAGGRHEYPQYDYGAHQPYGTPVAGYPAAQHHAAGYQSTPQHWAPQDHRQGQVHGQTQPQPHAPAPLSSTNYHPNYAPQQYTPGLPQPPTHQPGYPAAAAPPPQQHQAYHYPAAPASYSSQPAWSTHEQHAHSPQYGGQPRGAYAGDRGGGRAPSMGAHGRPEYGSPGMQPQVTGGYAPPQQYADPRAPPVSSYPPQPQYAYAPAPPPPAHMAHGREPYSRQHDGHHGGGGRGRGNFRGGNNQRGKHGTHHGGDRNRSRPNGPHGHAQRPDHSKPKAHSGPNNNNNANNNAKNNANNGGGPSKKKKRKTNTLGLTPGHESESEDDEKEEETLRNLLGPDALQIGDMASYIAERRKNFPSAARAKAAKEALAASAQGDKRAAALEREEKMAEKLRKQLEKVESSIKRKREQQDEGDDMRESSAPAGSDDDAPEAISTRAPPGATLQANGRKADVSKHCKYFSTGGTCGKKGKCRFVHDPEVRAGAMKEREANNGQLTIQQRLLLNDKDQEDLTVLQSIQYLRQKGVIDAAAAAASAAAAAEDKASTANGGTSSLTLPKQAHGLPAKPPSRRDNRSTHEPPPSVLQMAKTSGPVGYKGWNLSGYGNTGLKSEDLP